MERMYLHYEIDSINFNTLIWIIINFDKKDIIYIVNLDLCLEIIPKIAVISASRVTHHTPCERTRECSLGWKHFDNLDTNFVNFLKNMEKITI